LILSWIFGILFALVGIASVFSEPIPGLGMLIMAAVLLPPVVKLIEQKSTFKLTRTIKAVVVIISLIIFGVTVDTSNTSKNTSFQDEQQNTANTQQDKQAEEEQPHTDTNEQPKNEEKTETIPAADTVSAIENAINATGDYEVTVWTINGDFANAKSSPPFEVIVNTTASQIQDCFDAKNKLFNVMKAVYDSNALKSDVARIKFTAWGQLKASLGSQDAGFDWSVSEPSNLWKILQQYKSYEDESSSLNQRTYGVRINSSCE
jgi:archaellum component FlaF (FlaF/FlaG flagellin family)